MDSAEFLDISTIINGGVKDFGVKSFTNFLITKNTL